MALTASEIDILQTVQKYGSQTVRSFIDRNSETYDDQRIVAVRIAMERLTEQGFLTRSRNGKANVYSINQNLGVINFSLLDKV